MQQPIVDDHLTEELTGLRRRLHQYAELSGQEQQTPGLLKDFLKNTAPDEVREGMGGSGLAVIYNGSLDGPTVMIRAELDALPIPETVSLPYASGRRDVSHKCGHDGHMAMVAGVGLLAGRHPVQSGRLILLFQPAEETGEGAARLMEDPQFRSLEPDFLFALHNLPGFNEGEVILKKGVFSSASRGYAAHLVGQTAHAGHPDHARSPAEAIAGLMQTLPALPSRCLPLHRSGQITVIHARLGEIAFGTTPGQGAVMATLRAHYNEDIDRLAHETGQLVQGYCRTYGLQSREEWQEVFDATVNDDDSVDRILQAARMQGVPVRWMDHPFPWSEDFGQFTRHYGGALFGLGAGLQQPQLHSGDYDFPDRLIPVGTGLFWTLIRQLLDTASH